MEEKSNSTPAPESSSEPTAEKQLKQSTDESSSPGKKRTVTIKDCTAEAVKRGITFGIVGIHKPKP